MTLAGIIGGLFGAANNQTKATGVGSATNMVSTVFFMSDEHTQEAEQTDTFIKRSDTKDP